MIDLPNFSGKRIVLDAELLVVYVCGFIRSIDFGNSRPVSDYTMDDFEDLVRIVASCKSCITTPYLIAEASNLFGKAQDYYAEQYRAKLGELIQKWTEKYKASKHLLQPGDRIVTKFGIADKSVFELAKEAVVVFTADGPLTGLLGSHKLPVWNWDVYRNLRGRFR